MTPPIDELLQLEMVTFQPRTGHFDMDQVGEALGRIGFPFRDDADLGRMAFCVSAESRDMFQAKRRANPEGPFPFLLLADLSPGTITVSPVTFNEGQKELSRQVLTWLVESNDCYIGNELGADLTKA